MYLNEWDPRLDTGSGRTGKVQKHGKCDDCAFKGDAMQMVRHHRHTQHRYRYLGHPQTCSMADCACSSKEPR